MTETYGSDVSKWQGLVPWSAFAAKEAFTFMKATEGALAIGTSDANAIAAFGLDPQFRHNRQQAEAFGLACGFYHFLRVDLGNVPEHEADWFCWIVGSLKPGQFVACDSEERASQDAVGRFLARVKMHFGINPFEYSYRDWFVANGVTYAGLRKYGVDPGLWLSAPDGPVPAPPVGGWPFTAIQQRNSGTADGDIFFGTRDQLLAYGAPFPPPPPPPPPPDVPDPQPPGIIPGKPDPDKPSQF